MNDAGSNKKGLISKYTFFLTGPVSVILFFVPLNRINRNTSC